MIYLSRQKKYLRPKQLKQSFLFMILSKSFHTTQTIMSLILCQTMIWAFNKDTTQTTAFWFLTKTLWILSTIYNLNKQKSWLRCVQTKQLKQPFFRLTRIEKEYFNIKDNQCNWFFVITSSDVLLTTNTSITIFVQIKST